MAELHQRPRVEAEVVLKLNEAELRALHALADYGADAFIKCFYREMGRTRLEPHEKALRSLLELFGSTGRTIIERSDKAREAFGWTT